MNTINLRDEVRRALDRNWDSFAKDHPNLAKVIDQKLLVEQATQSLADDPEYQSAMEQSHAIAIGAHALVSFAERFIARFLRELL